MARLAAAMHNIPFNPFYVVEFAVKSDALHPQQSPHHLDRLTHGLHWFLALDADVLRERVPPRADSADDSIRREIIERQKGRGEQTDVARPVVDDAAADFNFRCDGCVRC